MKKQRNPIKQTNRNAAKNQRYYKQKWDSMPDKLCHECGTTLPFFSPIFISHIITKNCLPSHRYDLRAAVLMCADCHYTWEFQDKTTMKCFPELQALKEKLTLEYYNQK